VTSPMARGLFRRAILEIPFAFEAVSASEADLAMAGTISRYWVDFVKAGDPNGGGQPAWPCYDPATGCDCRSSSHCCEREIRALR